MEAYKEEPFSSGYVKNIERIEADDYSTVVYLLTTDECTYKVMVKAVYKYELNKYFSRIGYSFRCEGSVESKICQNKKIKD
jgi:hypothetical protein